MNDRRCTVFSSCYFWWIRRETEAEWTLQALDISENRTASCAR